MELKLKPTTNKPQAGDFLVTHDNELRQVCRTSGSQHTEYFLVDPMEGKKTTSQYESIEEMLDDVYFTVIRVIPNNKIKLVEI